MRERNTLQAGLLAVLTGAALDGTLTGGKPQPGDATRGHICGRDNGFSPRIPQRNHPCPCGSGRKFKKCCRP